MADGSDLPAGDTDPSGCRVMTASLREVEGPFFRSVLADWVSNVLAPPAPESAGRYHRLGQAALHLSPTIEWVTIAVSGRIREDSRPRMVVPLAALAGETSALLSLIS
jgi:hypothetical protein